MKKVLFVLIILLTVFLIYIGFKDEKIYYFNTGDNIALGKTPLGSVDYNYADYIKDYLDNKDLLEKYVTYATSDMHVTDIIKNIETNVKIETDSGYKHIQNVLIKSDLVTISIGSNDFLNNLAFNNEFSMNDLYANFELAIPDFEHLFQLIREYCKEEIVMIGFYDRSNNENLNEFFKYVNNKMDIIAREYNIKYVNIYNMVKENYPSKGEYQQISEEILKNTNFNK